MPKNVNKKHAAIFGKVIAEARIARELPVEQLAKKIGVSRPAVSAWEAGTASPGFTNMMKLSRALNMPLSAMIRLVEQEINK